jgi:hypothetical protein
LTHYVGVAGLGADAASYVEADKNFGYWGIFGYDRRTKLSDIEAKDGLANTMMMIQVPPMPRSPWLAGGGSTIRGVPDNKDPIRPFVSTTYQGKKGTYVLMADGSVRFVFDTIDPAVFKALATWQGKVPAALDDTNAPIVPPGASSELRTEPKP